MSGPFRFQPEDARSPLDRSASPFSAGQPVSFKTNVNRAKTKKWVQAKKNAYDGDDWGEYDEYDEYGVNQEPQHSEPAPAHRYYAQRADQPPRSFTDPSQQAPLAKGRRNSFEQGEEQRAFSSTIPHTQQAQGRYGEPQHQVSGSDYDAGDGGDFSPSAVPPPLQTRISQVPAQFSPPTNSPFPPRKSSIGQGDSPMAMSPRPRTGSNSDKPLPFIRPADIYKRHQEDRERASLDSSRPSLDSLSSRPKDDAEAENGKSLQPLETVAERKSEYMPDFHAAAPQGDEQPSQHDRSVVSPPDDQGLRSVVDQAFTRTDDQRSVPPTPISNDSSSDLLRSNTGSTSGISPIMSRVPSSATAALKNRNQMEGSTPAIAEEPSEIATPVTQPTPANIVEALHQVPRKPSPSHSRNFSSSSTPRSGLATPTRGDSPARSPALSPQRHVPEPKSALFTTESNETSEAMEGGLQGPSSAYAAREADIATAAKSRPGSGNVDLGAAERLSQTTFLESHNAQSPIEDALPRDRSESPSKGRVQALAGKFGEVASSRRGSTQSNLSRNSAQSWEKSRDNSRAASPTKASPRKAGSPVKEFRPHLPGQWESYATTAAMTPSEHGEQDRGLNYADKDTTSLEKSDLTPTTAKHPVAEVLPSDTATTDPLTALRDAGAAMVDSIRTTVGLNDNNAESPEEQDRRANHGNLYLPRPLQLDRTTTSTSSAPPTPPAKDTPASEFPPPPPLKEKSPQPSMDQPERPSLDPQLSTDPTNEDQESDRLRKEIVASLSPFKMSEETATEPKRASLQPSISDANRASSILPREYETYWADEDGMSPQPLQNTERNTHEQPSAKSVSFLPQSDEPTKPVILHRFSWEASGSQIQTPDEQVPAASDVGSTQPRREEGISSPPFELAVQQGSQKRSESPPGSYFGPEHTLTVTKSEPTTDTEVAAQSPGLALNPLSAAPPSRGESRSPGLHVVNTETDPEAVDLPPRFNAEQQQAEALAREPGSVEEREVEPIPEQTTLESSREETLPVTAQESGVKSPITDKPLGAREIATLHSASERINTYNKTREYWATTDHGLGDWLASTLEAKPELATQSFPVQRPPTGSTRHRHTGSLALFGKLGGSNSHDTTAEQRNGAGVPVHDATNSPGTGTPSGSGFGGRIANQQMQLKGKDLLHTANVLSGKGMTSAKGLFAKGKSRFGREKVDK